MQETPQFIFASILPPGHWLAHVAMSVDPSNHQAILIIPPVHKEQVDRQNRFL
jgi:hypothetical protein